MAWPPSEVQGNGRSNNQVPVIYTHDHNNVFFSRLVIVFHSKSESVSVIILTLRTSSEVDVELDLFSSVSNVALSSLSVLGT